VFAVEHVQEAGCAVLTVVRLVVMLGMLLVVPLGLRLVTGRGIAALRRWWPAVAAPAAAGLWLPRGPLAVLTAVGYAAAAALLAALAARRLLRRGPGPREIAVATACAGPLVAACALVAERAGHRLLGFELPVLVLTVAHFHFAGFAAALIAGLAGRAAPGRAGDLAAVTVPAGVGLVLVGFLTGDWVELAGALLLTAGMFLVGLLTWRQLRPVAGDRLARALLGVSAAVLAATMLLAVSWALGEATGLPHPSLAWMAATHGLGNALGFAVCGMFALARLRAEPL
jgi:YndJ-like protein